MQQKAEGAECPIPGTPAALHVTCGTAVLAQGGHTDGMSAFFPKGLALPDVLFQLWVSPSAGHLLL